MASLPSFHVSGKSKAVGKGLVMLQSRQDLVSAGTFSVVIDVRFDPAIDEYPTGGLIIEANLSDSLKGSYKATSIELINCHGKHNPTIYLTGRCKTTALNAPKGLRYWIMIADNTNAQQGTPDVVSFVINERNGNRVAYGTGSLKSGNIKIDPS